MKKITYGWILAVLLLPGMLISQINLKGQILENEEGIGIPFALVKSGDQAVSTDKTGNFEITVPTEKGVLSVERIGFYPMKISIKEFMDLDKGVLKLKHRPIVFGEIIIEDSPVHSIPQSDEIIDEIKMMSQPMDAGDLIRGVNGFGVSKRGAYAQEPVFRSFRQEQINILFDGFIQYNHACPNRMDPAVTHVIPEEINKVEIIKGPFSVRYGSTMGATLNYLTESAMDGKMGLSGTVESGYEFNGEGKSGRASLGYRAKKFDVYVNGSIKDYENYTSGTDSIATIVPSAFSSKDYGVKLGINPAINQRLMLPG